MALHHTVRFKFENEDVATNGKILIFSEELPEARHPHLGRAQQGKHPQKITTLDGAGEHTMSCILDCKWLYGSDGGIIDLRNPKKPKDTGADWGGNRARRDRGAPRHRSHGNRPDHVAGRRKNPTKPKLLANAKPMDEFVHSVQWPRKGADDFIMAAGETWVPGQMLSARIRPPVSRTWDATN